MSFRSDYEGWKLRGSPTFKQNSKIYIALEVTMRDGNMKAYT